MDLDFGLIRSIHSLLRQQSDLKYRLEQIPRRLKLAQSNEARFLASWEAAKIEYRRLHMSIDERQLQLDEREARIAQMKVRMNMCDSNKEFQLIKECIAADTQANSVLQDEIFELLERHEAQKLVCDTEKRNSEKSKSERETISQSLITEQQELANELTRVAQTLKDEERKLKGDVLSEYRHSVRGLGENIFGESDGQSCGNCSQNLTIQKTNDLVMKRAVYCQGCGCLLYVTEKEKAVKED